MNYTWVNRRAVLFVYTIVNIDFISNREKTGFKAFKGYVINVQWFEFIVIFVELLRWSRAEDKALCLFRMILGFSGFSVVLCSLNVPNILALYTWFLQIGRAMFTFAARNDQMWYLYCLLR